MVTRQRAVPTRLGAPLLVAVIATLLCAAVWVGDPTTPNGILPPCPIKALLGIDCPGCGSLRMLYSLLHGDLWAAFRFNALGVVALVLVVWAYLAWTYGRVVGRRIESWQHSRWAALVALVLWSLWLVVRNLPIAPFTALYV